MGTARALGCPLWTQHSRWLAVQVGQGGGAHGSKATPTAPRISYHTCLAKWQGLGAGGGGGWLRWPRLDWPGHLQAKIVAVMLFGQSLPIPPQPAVWGPAALCCRSVLGSPLCFRVPCGAWAGPEQGALPPAYLVTWFPPASGAGRAQARARGTESRCTGSPSGARGPRVSPCCCGGPVPPPHTSPL